MTTQLGVFAKYWRSGDVKTRLAKSIGPAAASAVYREFVLLLLRRFSATADQRVLAYAPREREAEFRAVAGGVAAGDAWRLEPQHAGGLGQRMQAYFMSAHERGAERVVLIGSDSPTLPVEWIEQAFEKLQAFDVVVGPSEDGGYYLIGVRGALPPIFTDIRWSTSDVLPQTLAALAAAGASYHLLPKWYDVDQLQDLRRLQRELQEHEPDSLHQPLILAVETALSGSIPTDDG